MAGKAETRRVQAGDEERASAARLVHQLPTGPPEEQGRTGALARSRDFIAKQIDAAGTAGD
jgi:hypothetical protein